MISPSQSTLALSKFQILDGYVTAPGYCISCGSASRVPVIDTGVTLDYLGAILFCYQCAQEIGRVSGLVDPIVVETPVAEVEAEDIDFSDVLISFIDRVDNLLSNFEAGKPVAKEPEFTTPKTEPVAGQDGNTSSSKKPARVPSSKSNGPEFSFTV